MLEKNRQFCKEAQSGWFFDFRELQFRNRTGSSTFWEPWLWELRSRTGEEGWRGGFDAVSNTCPTLKIFASLIWLSPLCPFCVVDLVFRSGSCTTKLMQNLIPAWCWTLQTGYLFGGHNLEITMAQPQWES